MASTVTDRYGAADVMNGAMLVAALASWAVVLFYAATQMMPRAQYGVQFLGAMTIVYVLHQGIDAAEERDYLDLALLGVLGVVTALITVYVNVYFETLLYTRLGYALEQEYLLGGLFILGILYLTYRAYGMTFASVVVGALLYGYYGEYFPGLLSHGGYSLRAIINLLVWEFSGLYGNINQIVATWVALFLLYAGLMRGYGAFDLILRAAFTASQFIKSGVAQAAVTASIIIGSITGSQTANTAITGSFTIPLMKESGLRAETAGGIESVASSGGQIMPPVMGAAAFVMASLLGVSYVAVLVAGVIPAAVFYISVVAGVHYSAMREMEDVPSPDITDYVEEEKSRREIAIQSIRFIIPFVVLLYTLGIIQMTVMSAALYTVYVMLATGIAFPIVRSAIGDLQQGVGDAVRQVGRETLDGFRYGAVTLAPIGIVIAAINGIVDLLMRSGVPGKFSLALLGISGGVLAAAAVLSMAVCIILGLGMPTVAAYIIVAFLIAPALINEFGVPEMAAHYFVFYSAILSGLTPPIAIAVVVATGISGGNFWGTAIAALKIAVSLFVLPFAFIYNPEIVVGGFNLETAFSGLLALLGALAIIHGLNFHTNRISNRVGNLGLRVVYSVLGLAAMVVPEETIRVGALVIAIGLLVAQRRLLGSVTDVVEESVVTED